MYHNKNSGSIILLILLINRSHVCFEVEILHTIMSSFENVTIKSFQNVPINDEPVLLSCIKCGFKCERSDELQNHVVSYHKKVIYTCSICKRTYVRKAALLRHEATHADTSDYCSSNGKLLGNASIAQCKENNENLFACPVCDYRSSQLSDVNIHLTIHTEDTHKLLNCSKCEYSCTSHNSFKKHMQIHNVNVTFYCPECDYESSRKDALKRHMVTIHNVNVTFSCPECDYVSSRKDNLKRHMVSHKIMMCSKCNFFCKGKGEMRLHMETHLSKSFSCTMCGDVFAKNCNLTRHMLYSCNKKHSHFVEYGNDNITESNFDKQKENHNQPTIFACNECDYTSKTNINLKKHMLQHTGGNNFSCSECNYVCSNIILLNEHISVHIDMNNLTCSECAETFFDIDKLKYHYMTHKKVFTKYNQTDQNIHAQFVEKSKGVRKRSISTPIKEGYGKRIKSDKHFRSNTTGTSYNSLHKCITQNTMEQTQSNIMVSNTITELNLVTDIYKPDMSDLEIIESIRKKRQIEMEKKNFTSDFFQNNPLIEAGKNMYRELEKTEWTRCIVCKESHICFPVNYEGKCERCAGEGIQASIFTHENDLDPGEAPECLTRLTPVEKSAISIICPSLTVVKCGSYSSKSKGHAISFYQNVQDLADNLPRLPQDLPYVLLKHPDDRITDKTFQVRRQYLIEALQFLIINSEDYGNITINMENCSAYPEDDIIQNLPQISSNVFKVPHEAPSTANPDSTIEDASTVDMPFPIRNVLQNLESTIEGYDQQSKYNWPRKSSSPVSEFIYGYFSKAFPDLFPYGKGDITKSRLCKNPSLTSYIRHVLRLYRRFVTHHCFIFVVTNISRRHLALTLGNVFTKRSASDLSLSDLKKALSENNDRVIRKLLYFAAPIPGTRQDLWYQRDKAMSIIKFIRIISNNNDFFNVFHTVSAADLHWDDLHRLLPGSENYLNMIVVKNLDELPIDADRRKYIDQATDYQLRSKNLRKYPDIVVTYLHHRVHTMLQFFWKPLGLKDHIIRYEVQNRGTMHAHMLLCLKKSVSTMELQKAFIKPTVDMPNAEKLANKEAKEKLIDFSVNTLGVSAVHPNPDPKQWPSPFGSNIYCPPQNCLRQRFLDINDMNAQYENLINRVMIHMCRFGICLNDKRKDSSGNILCRFKFPMDTLGFTLQFDELGSKILSAYRNDISPNGADIVGEDLVFVRNHPTLVHHIPELLTVWCANVETRPVKSYDQVIRYLLKYLVKPEPNSPPFESMLKSVVEGANDDDAVRKVLQKILMKTVGEHDLCLQECLHILNDFPVVEFSRKFVSANVGSTRKVKTTGNDNEPATTTNLADIYWGRSSDKHYIQLYNKFTSGKISVDPEKVSLYEFMSNYSKTWKFHGNGYVPHITPNFNKIPKKSQGNNDRYLMFLKNILLVHQAGSTHDNINSLDDQQLHLSVRNFVYSAECPTLVLEEYEESQAAENDTDNDTIIDDDPLQREPEREEIVHEQDDIMCLLKPIQTADETMYEVEHDYHDNIITDLDADWEQDRRDFGFTDDDLKNAVTWIDTKKKENILLESSQDMEPPTNDNKQQMNAFAILKQYIDSNVDPNKQTVPQLLLQINGPAGSGKSYWIQKVKGYAKKIFKHNNFVQTAAPSGTASFLIKGETIHALLMLPIDYSSYNILSSDRLFELQQKFKSIGIIVIDEKSMVGHRILHMADMRLREIYPHRREEVFGGLSMVLIGDWKQLPPVGDSSLFDNKSKCAAGFNIYSNFIDVINFSKIERQTGPSQQEFREELARLSEGKFTENDWRKWRSRTLDLLPPNEQEEFRQTAVLACSEKKNMIQHNINKVRSNNQPIALIHAVSNCSAAKKASSDKACGLLNELVVSKDSVVRLTANLWTKAGLTNGAKGLVKGIIYAPNSKPPALPICLIVTFDKYYGPSFIESIPKSVPICPVRREWYSQKKTLTRTMLPLILGYALSIHKLQGETLDKVILNIGDREFQTGLTLVGASRVKSFEGLAFSPFPNYHRFKQIGNSHALKRRIKEEERLEILHQKTINKYHDIITKCLDLYKIQTDQ